MINDTIMSNNGFGWKKAAVVVDAAREVELEEGGGSGSEGGRHIGR